MQRIPVTPRTDWQQKVEAVGLTFHTLENGTPYWDESAAYEFTGAEIDTLEAAGNTLQEMCLAAAQHVIDEKRYAELDIPEQAIPAIEWAWNNEPPALYGRFDIAWAGAQSGYAPKLLEYNADTPTSLLEAAVVQWDWLKQLTPQLPRASSGGDADQFNSIHDKLIAKWRDLDQYLAKPIYFAGVNSPEDQLTLAYLRDTAQQAGLETLQMYMEEIGWNDERQAFVDPNEDQMFTVFKLYPWEMMVAEEFGVHTLATYPDMRWIEPIWKMLLSNKGILPILWQLYPNHELLLPAFFDTTTTQTAPTTGGWQDVNINGATPPSSALALSPATHNLRDYVRKPLFSREGANVTLVRDGVTVDSTTGPYTGRQIVQALAPEAVFPAPDSTIRHPVLGLWMIDQECAGLGIRESANPITDNLSSFVPHYFR
jgi:glutathionylspermidine synthase